MVTPSERAETFEAHRAHLLAVAYRMTGTLADAEDLVQEAFLRWVRVEDEIDEPRAYLTTMVTRLSIDHQRSARMRRERYVGPWLPEPVLGERALAADAATELADDVSMALLLALDRLSPLERAAFILHEVFDVGYAELAATLVRSEAACRKLVERARASVRRSEPKRRTPKEEAERILGAFLFAVNSGDVEGLSQLLTEDVVLYSDGGGKVSAALRPILGPSKVARFFVGVAKNHPLPPGHTVELAVVNGAYGVVIRLPDGVEQILSFELTSDGRIARIYGVRNPDKLARAAAAIGHPTPSP